MFKGRKHELSELESLYKRGDFQMVVLYGRRRVGKTTLALEFAKKKPLLTFTAKQQSDALNLADFSAEIYRFCKLPDGTGSFASWDDALAYLAQAINGKHVVFLFDEFPYAAKSNTSLPSTLQIAIDRHFTSTDLFLILSGSNEGFMEEKVLGRAKDGSTQSTLGEQDPLFGRRTSQIHLAPFGYKDASQMLHWLEPEQLIEYYACFGGTPYYLSRIDKELTLAKNIERLFFRKEGLLYEEPMMLLRQELREPAVYNSILSAIAGGANVPSRIADKVGLERTSVTKYLSTLISLHLIKKAVPFGENQKTSRKGIYQITEPCFDFWFHFVEPFSELVEQNTGVLAAKAAMKKDALSTHVGGWFETICQEWLIEEAIQERLPISPLKFGKWWGTNQSTYAQDDIDVIAADQNNHIALLGECKWRESFNETKALEKLHERSEILTYKGYQQFYYALFTKHPVSEATNSKYEDGHLFISAEDLYR